VGFPNPLDVYLDVYMDFDAATVDAMLERLTVLRNQLLPPLPAPRRPRSDHPSVSRQRQGGPPDSCP